MHEEMAEILGDPAGRSRGEWVLLASHRWEECCQELGLGRLPHYSRGKLLLHLNVHRYPSFLEQHNISPRTHTTKSVKSLEVPPM